MPLVWITGNSGVGKSTVCSALLERGHKAIDTDDEYCHWMDRVTRRAVTDPPDPVPPGWLDNFGWYINRAEVEALSTGQDDQIVFLCGSAENEVDVRDLFDLILCIVADDDTLKERLANRTTNDFGKNPEELAAVLYWNPVEENRYRQLGAIIIDGQRSIREVTDDVVQVTHARLSALRED